MVKINVESLDFRELNNKLRTATDDCLITGCCGQRFIAAGMSQRRFTVEGIPGNALGAYLNGAEITVNANAQDAVGDTMNDGRIVIHGNIGDAAGYAMRGGQILVKGNAGYRAGIHMKAYKNKIPLMIIGGTAGSFLGEYQAGGVIVVLGISDKTKSIIGDFPCTGMHGGKMFLRCDCDEIKLPPQVTARTAGNEDKDELYKYVKEYCRYFGNSIEDIMQSTFTVVTPNGNNPFRQMYVAN